MNLNSSCSLNIWWRRLLNIGSCRKTTLLAPALTILKPRSRRLDLGDIITKLRLFNANVSVMAVLIRVQLFSSVSFETIVMSNWSGYSANNGLCDVKVGLHTNCDVLGGDLVGDNTSAYAGVSVDLRAFSCTETIPFRLTETHFNYQYILLTTHYIILSGITTIYYSIRT